MNSESLTNVLTRQWRIVTGSKTVNPRNRMPETGASGSVGAPLEESGALPGNGLASHAARGPLPFIPFTLLNFVTLLKRSRRNIFFEKVISFFEMLRLELPRGLITQGAVKPFVIVVDFDILEQLATRNRLGIKNLSSWQTFAFKRAKERFGLRVGVGPELQPMQRIQNSIFG